MGRAPVSTYDEYAHSGVGNGPEWGLLPRSTRIQPGPLNCQARYITRVRTLCGSNNVWVYVTAKSGSAAKVAPQGRADDCGRSRGEPLAWSAAAARQPSGRRRGKSQV